MVYVRPDGAYDGQQITNRRKYQDDSVAVPRVAISSTKVDGDINYLIDAANELDQAIQDITVGGVPDGSITTTKLADNAVTSAKIGDGEVTADKVVNGNITTAKLADNAVNNAKLATEAVNTVNILDNAVTTAKLANGSVTEDKLSSSLVISGSDYINDIVTVVGTNQVTWQGSCQAEDNTELLTSATDITGTLGSPTATTEYAVWVGYNAEDTLAIEIIDSTSGTLNTIVGKRRLVRKVRTNDDSHLVSSTLTVQYNNPNLDSLQKGQEVELWSGNATGGQITLSERFTNYRQLYFIGYDDFFQSRQYGSALCSDLALQGTNAVIKAFSMGNNWVELTKNSDTQFTVTTSVNIRIYRIVGVR